MANAHRLGATFAVCVAISSPSCFLLEPEPKCPGRFQECLGGCIPENGVCCGDGSYCLSPTACVWGGFGYTCSQGGYHQPSCDSGSRHCGTECKPGGSSCCIGDECYTLVSGPHGGAQCGNQAGYALCGVCPEQQVACSGACRFCPTGATCQGDLCGAMSCCTPSGACGVPRSCGGSAGAADAGSVTCAGGWQGSMAVHGAVGTSDPCAGSGAVSTCINSADYRAATGRQLPAACLPESSSGCIDTSSGVLVHPCCPGLTCVYRERCGAAANASGGQCIRR